MKNIILDIGGVLLNIDDDVLVRFLNKNMKEIKELNKIVYEDKRWNECLLGNISHQEYLEQLIVEYPKYKNEIEKMLLPEYQTDILPPYEDTINYIYNLKKEGYCIYFLSNLTEVSYYYLKNELKILDDFNGGIFSWKEHLLKPDAKIYELLIKRYGLDKNETIFFDDTLNNVIAASGIGIKSIQYKNISDIKDNI